MNRLGWIVAFASVAVLVPAVACITGNVPPPGANCTGDKTGCSCTALDNGATGNGGTCPPPAMSAPVCCADVFYGAAGKTCSCKPSGTPSAECRSDQGTFCECQEGSIGGPDSGSFAACPPGPTKWAYCCANEGTFCACYTTPGACTTPSDSRATCVGDTTLHPCALSGDGTCTCELGNSGSATTCPPPPAVTCCMTSGGATGTPACACDFTSCSQGWTQVANCTATALLPYLLDAGSGNTCTGYLQGRINACTPVPKPTY